MLGRERALNWYRRWSAQASVSGEPVCCGIHGLLALSGYPRRPAKLLRVDRQGARLVLPMSKSVFLTRDRGRNRLMVDHCHADTSLLAQAESKERMLRAWRRVTVVALTGSMAMAALLAAVVPARAATTTITVSATSSNPTVTGDVWVIYQNGKWGTARIHGAITGAAAGEVATLYAQQFPYTTAAKPVRSITLSAAGTARYSFTVTPTLATRYKVELFARKSATTPLATSPRQNVYVASDWWVTGRDTCGRPVCRLTYHLFLEVPRSALAVEMSKHVYPYFGVNFGAASNSPPRWLYLNGGHGSVSSVQKIYANGFESTLTFSFTVGNNSAYWDWNLCAKDTESRDGLGLPGSHGCGASRVLQTANYLG